MNLNAIIRAVQKELGVDADGAAGPQTWMAIYNRLLPGTPAPAIAADAGKIDDRSERVIATLLPEVQPYARALIGKASAAGITIKVISGLRTYDEQNELYRQGRDKPGSIVTNARGGFSNHNFGIAFDIGVFEGTKYLDESPKYKAVGALGTDIGLEWGGNWKSIQDEPHFQLRPRWASDMSERDMLAELRARKDSGRGAYA
jgi:peptidoglycan L-alanyl-D-glutamate endopeptidase CwlK